MTMTSTCQSSDAAQAIAASVAQIELAVREVQPVVEQLGSLIDEMSTGLGALRAARPRNFDPNIVAVFPDEFDRAVAKLQKHVNGSITHLQFYDRMVQHLAHVQDFLSGAAGELANHSTSELADATIWGELRSKLRKRLISDSQRQLLDAMLPPPGGVHLSSADAREEHGKQGSVELF
jgi:hypothetical protein